MRKNNSIAVRSLIIGPILTLNITIGLLFTVTAGATARQSTEKQVKLELKDSSPAIGASPDGLYNVKVYLETDKAQPNASEGLVFVVIFVNAGSSRVDLLDPKDLTHPEILTEDGWPVRLLDTGLSSFIHRVPAPGESQPKGPAIIHLAPGQEYRLPIRVLQIFPIQKEPPQEPKPASNQDATVEQKLVAIPAGHYKVRLRVSLAHMHGTSAMKGQRMLVSDWVDVVLGQ
jgi:hypothetical protein